MSTQLNTQATAATGKWRTFKDTAEREATPCGVGANADTGLATEPRAIAATVNRDLIVMGSWGGKRKEFCWIFEEPFYLLMKR